MKGRRATRAWWLGLVLALGLHGCAAHRPAPYGVVPGGSRADVARRLAAAMVAEIADLARSARAAETCPELCRLGERICEAAAKICEIAAAEPGDRELADRCGHARMHCDVARDRCQRCSAR